MFTLRKPAVTAAALLLGVGVMTGAATAANAAPAPTATVAASTATVPAVPLDGVMLLQGPTTDIVGKGAMPGARITITQADRSASTVVGTNGFWAVQLPQRPLVMLPQTGTITITQTVGGHTSAPSVYVVAGFQAVHA